MIARFRRQWERLWDWVGPLGSDEVLQLSDMVSDETNRTDNAVKENSQNADQDEG